MKSTSVFLASLLVSTTVLASPKIGDRITVSVDYIDRGTVTNHFDMVVEYTAYDAAKDLYTLRSSRTWVSGFKDATTMTESTTEIQNRERAQKIALQDCTKQGGTLGRFTLKSGQSVATCQHKYNESNGSVKIMTLAEIPIYQTIRQEVLINGGQRKIIEEVTSF